jgi:stage II sporulation protein P
MYGPFTEGFFMYHAPYCNYRTQKLKTGTPRFFILAGLLFLLLLGLNKAWPDLWFGRACAGTLYGIPARIIDSIQRDPVKLLGKAMPALTWGSFEGEGDVESPPLALLGFLSTLARVRVDSPVSVLSSALSRQEWGQKPEMATAPVAGVVPSVAETGVSSGKIAAGGAALVCIYNTHTGETYSLTDGVERVDRLHGGVVTFSAPLQHTLKKKSGIATARSYLINDINYNDSYLESEKTARELLAANQKTQVILDIHRDSGKTREQSVVKVNGQDVAPILLIVGSDARRPFPAWRQNHAFANELSRRMNEVYPGLSLGVRVKDGLYNQHLHTGAVLVEMGTSNNSLEEAIRSAQLLADILAGMITR